MTDLNTSWVIMTDLGKVDRATAGRRVVWVSAGAASAVAAKLTLSQHPQAVLAYCDTGAEHPDNARFLGDLEIWFDRPVKRLKSDRYADTWDVWESRKFLSGIAGSPCTLELKVKPRLLFQQESDIHVFGYTADGRDVQRAEALRENFPELSVEVPLIDAGLNKAACLDIVLQAGLSLPVTYAQGYPNANCLPCVKATSPNYWALVRKTYPEKFDRMARLSRDLGVKLCRINNERRYIDEIPAGWPVSAAIQPECDLLCALAAQDLSEPPHSHPQTATLSSSRTEGTPAGASDETASSC